MKHETSNQLRQISTATLTTQLLRRGIRHGFMEGVKPLGPDQGRIVGEAYTLRYLPLREDLNDPQMAKDPNFPPRACMEEVPEGGILVVDARGVTTAAVVGDILISRLKARNVAAFVTDGNVRDADTIRGLGFPVWSAGASAPGYLSAHSPGDRQLPIGCGNVAVIPGDILVCDGDGVVVVPRALASEIAIDGLEEERFESWVQSQVEGGRAIPGLYPPNAETLAEYEAWCAANPVT